ncbi:hypothetical protein NAP1_01630 [Erythrobacter sp. NAP1]|uniref:DUF938 domain-containing protein n=1 Tax=Erythrobacter sp. NAP1 TaxID=237727 RepID=UPI0000686E8C|nr:DUF938 domain-containing protein [Erythrobacter sp. NAP1]EAQ29432.1 hypothetical protein NAP1_01630 [Erythrobacter sp. NAP1]
MKKHAPATLRNREAIAEVLEKELPPSGRVLEVASGSGEHAVFFAGRFPQLEWQPSDFDREAIASILAYRSDYDGTNLPMPMVLDTQTESEWEIMGVDAIVCINMLHIAPWAATEGLFRGAAQLLSGRNLPLILYGPYFEQDVEATPSNKAFDEGLRARNPEWGIRNAEDLGKLASTHGFARTARYEMPANNLTLVFRSA